MTPTMRIPNGSDGPSARTDGARQPWRTRSADPPLLLSSELGFRARSRLYFTELLSTTTRSPLRWLDTVRPAGGFRAAVDRHAGEYLERLMRSNASRVTGDLDDRVLESRRGLEREVR